VKPESIQKPLGFAYPHYARALRILLLFLPAIS
jgi:hypothetical protein